MIMKNPPHPGLSVRHDCIEPLDLTITETAEILGVTRNSQQSGQRQERHFGGYGAATRQGIRRRRGNVAAAPNGLRPRAGPRARRRHKRHARDTPQAARTTALMNSGDVYLAGTQRAAQTSATTAAFLPLPGHPISDLMRASIARKAFRENTGLWTRRHYQSRHSPQRRSLPHGRTWGRSARAPHCSPVQIYDDLQMLRITSPLGRARPGRPRLAMEGSCKKKTWVPTEQSPWADGPRVEPATGYRCFTTIAKLNNIRTGQH